MIEKPENHQQNFANVTFADLIVRSAYQMGKTPLLPIFAASLGASDALLGFIVSVSTLTGMLFKPLIGLLSDRWGRRLWLLIGTSFFAIIPFFYWLIESPTQLVVIRIVHGMATAVYGPVTLAYVSEQTQKKRGERLGVFGMARSAGYVVGPAAAGLLLLVWSPAAIFTLIGVVSSVAFVPVLFLTEAEPRIRVAPKSAVFAAARRVAFLPALRSSLQTPAIWLGGGLEATMYVVTYAVKAFLPIYALAIGVNVALVGTFFALQEAVHMLLKPLGGRFGDRRGYLVGICVGMTVLGLTLPALALAGNTAVLLLIAVLMGVAQACIVPATTALIAEQADRHHLGASMGIIGTLKNGGKVAGPILGGFFIALFDYQLTFQLMGLLLLAWVALIWLLTWRRGGKTAVSLSSGD